MCFFWVSSSNEKLFCLIKGVTAGCCLCLLQRFGEPIEERYREHEGRPRAFDELGKKLQLFMKAVDVYKQKVSCNE